MVYIVYFCKTFCGSQFTTVVYQVRLLTREIIAAIGAVVRCTSKNFLCFDDHKLANVCTSTVWFKVARGYRNAKSEKEDFEMFEGEKLQRRSNF